MEKPTSDCPVQNLKDALADSLLDGLAKVLRCPAHSATFRWRLVILAAVMEALLGAGLVYELLHS